MRKGIKKAARRTFFGCAGLLGDLFEYQIGHPVTVRRDRSALIPIVQTRMEGARVSVFRETSASASRTS
ncbi:MAG TPA: hypothetical protein VK422_18810 [Pyrinomonadaceae bacterium]|nr:hypothetical protein [Pyrinomonadaceae bacterium]